MSRNPTATWIVSLFAASILLQRLSLPGGVIPLLLVAVFAWVGYGWLRGIVEFDPLRAKLFLAAAGVTAAVALVQTAMVPASSISLTSWGFFLLIWAPATLRLVDRSRETLIAALRGCVTVGTWLAAASVVMLVVQVAGLAYQDYLAAIVPGPLLLDGYVITYPLSWDSPIYRSNAWIGLEPSIISFQLGLTLLFALLIKARVSTVLLLGAGIVSTLSGSGIFLLLIGLPVLLLLPVRRNLWRFALPATAAIAVVLMLPLGQALASRGTELGSSGSSANLRAVEPYRFLAPDWLADPAGAIAGFGAGSSQQFISASDVPGLLVPTPIKIFFDYGLLAGAVLAAFLLVCYLGTPMVSVSLALLVSAWVLQPATTTLVLALPTMMFAAWWSPTAIRSLERDPPVPLEVSHA